VRPAAEAKGVDLRLEAPSVPATIRADGQRLDQLLDNLVSNAVKFTPDGGTVAVGLDRDGDDLVLTVSDTGIGIPAGEQRHLFERFFRASSAQKRAIDGTGLGLTIALAIAEAHGGSIRFASVEGEGTTFRIALPVDGPPAESAPEPGAREPSLV
ncbi:MAG TPA: ATP-binding protein, partial [Gaiellaceae bacterium]|nr:ATP-binding protein [Gaiellaceae bacterium]